MRFFGVALVMFAVIGRTSQAQIQKFPYLAVVESNEVYVRSGPGRKYYPTGKLSHGDRVTVHRHDPGGWYMISPPRDSFSWIRAEYVRRTRSDRGVLTANNVVVRVGSEFGDTRDVEQRRLSTGDEVEIIDEKTLRSERGPIRMFRIRPPQGEYRWIPGQFISPIDEVVRQQNDRNPFAVPSQARRGDDKLGGPNELTARSKRSRQQTKQAQKSAGNETGFVERQPVRTTDNDAVRRSGPTADRLEADRDQLTRLDDRFRAIIRQQTGRWDFAELEHDYRQLQKSAARGALSSQIDLRLAALQRYRKIKAEYDDFVRLTTKTNRRDAELALVQKRQLTQRVPRATQRPARRNPVGRKPIVPQPAAAQPVPSAIPRPAGRNPSVRHRPPAGGGPLIPGTVHNRPNIRRTPRFDGAGIVQRATVVHPGGPRHVLIAPNGRILAYLQADRGINLDQYLGRAMGVYGKRVRRADLQSDFIIVRGLTPVRLRP